MPQADALTGVQQQVRGAAHAFHAARDHDAVGAGLQLVMREDHRLHTGAAQLVDGCRAGRFGDAGGNGRLACRALAHAGWQHTAHDDLVDIAGGESTALDCRGYCRGPELHRAGARKHPVHATHRGARTARNHHCHVVHLSASAICNCCPARFFPPQGAHLAIPCAGRQAFSPIRRRRTACHAHGAGSPAASCRRGW